MVAIISGMRAGLNLSSREVLGQPGMVGTALEGRNGQGVYVNVAKGLLVVQNQDDWLASRGIDAGLLRTYNSTGSLNDDNGDGWLAGMQMLQVAGTVNSAGSTITKWDADGSKALYAYDAARSLYVSTEGGGAYDTIAYVTTDAQFEWRDGSTGATQRFEGSGACRLLLAKDTSGNALTYAYGGNGFLTSVTTASGETTFYDYVGNNLSQVRIVAGGVTSTRVRYAYDTSNRLASATVDLTPGDNSVADNKVYQTTYTYDGTSKRVASISQSDGTSLSFTYVDAGGGDWRVASVRDGLNQATTFTYGAGYTTLTDPLGLVTRYDYDASAQLTKITAPTVTGTTPTQQFTYNANGDVTSIVDGEGRTVTFQYDASGNQVLQRDQAGDTVTRTYDARNQLLTETVYALPDPDGAGAGQPGAPLTTRYVYDAAGRNLLRFAVSADGRVTEFRYDAFGQRVAAINYSSGQFAVSGLATGAALAESDLTTWAGTQNLVATQRVDTTYDARGQVQTRKSYARVDTTGAGVADGSQSIVQYVYDQAGLLLQTIDARNGTTSYTYDGLGRVVSSTDGKSQVTLTQYNDAGRKTAITLASGLVTTSTYDAAGRLVSVAQSNASAALLGETRYFYDADDRLRMTQDPTGVRAWMLYDAAGRKVADVDGTGTMTEYTYDGSGLLTYQVVYATAVNTAALVDASGLPVTTATAATVRPAAIAGAVREWRSYDAAHRLVRVARSFGTSSQVAVTENRYDGASRLVQVVSYANALTADTASVSPGVIVAPATSTADRVARNFYNGDGQLAGVLDGEGYLTVYNYDPAGRPVETIRYATPTPSAQRASGTLAQLVPATSGADIRSVNLYDAKGQLVGAVDGEGYLTENVYDGSGNLTQTVRYASRVTGTVSVGAALGSIRPASSAADRAVNRVYDALNRVIQETSPEGVVTQTTYDAVGNVVSTVRAAGTTEVRTLLARYDLQGRLVGELSANGAALLTGGQTQAQVDAVWAQYGAAYAYDAAGRRISMTDAAGSRTFFYYNADGALTHTVNALGEVRERRYDARGRLFEEYAYAGRISTAGLSGGLVPATLTTAVAAIASASDIRARYTYTSDDRQATSWDPTTGTVTTHTYDAFGAEIGTDQGLGGGLTLSQTYAYDHRGLRTGTVADPANVYALKTTTTTDYDAFGRATRAVDGNGNVRLQSYDRLGRVISAQDPLNALRSTSYDAFGRVLTQTDELGKVTTFAYDASARTMSVTTPEGVLTKTTSNRHGQVQSITDGKGQVTSYTYDRDGNVLQTSTPLTTSSSSYDGADRLVQTTDAAGNQVTYAYDAANRVLTRRVDTNGLNLTTTYQYDGKGQQVTVTDPNGVATTRQFDSKGQVLRETVDPTGLNLQTVYTYDARGNVLTVTSPGGTVTQYVYDVLGRRTQERVDPAGLNLTRSWAYDGNGNAVSSTDARGNVTRYAYDSDDRLVFTVDPLGDVQQLGYDAAGRVIKTVAYATAISLTGLPAKPALADIQGRIASQAAQDRVEHRVYDKDGRLTATVDGTGAVSRYTYDANGNVVARTAYATRINLATWTPGTLPAPTVDPAHDATLRTIYDGLDRAVFTVDGIGAVVAQTYDGNGNVLQRTAYATGVPTTTAATQAAIAAAVAIVANPARDASVRNVYDAAGRLAWTVDGTGAVAQRVYDKNGNVVRQVQYATAVATGAAPSSVVASGGDRSTAMAYDAANRLVFQVDALRGVTERVFDANGNVVRTTRYANVIATIPTLGASGTVAAIRAAITANPSTDRSARFGYDAAGRQVLAIDALGSVVESQYDAAGNSVATIAYATQVNVSGLAALPTLAAMRALIVTNTASDRTTSSAYDAAGQLVYRVDALRATTATQYDGVGRVMRTTRYATAIPGTTANTAAAVAAAVGAGTANDQTTLFTYNAAGQLITSTDAMGGIESFTYDALGNKLSFVNERGFAWTYAYDAAGRMLSETTPQVALAAVSVNAAGNLVAGATATAALITRFAYDALDNLTSRVEASGRAEQRTTSYEYDQLGRQVRVVYPTVAVYNAAGDNATANGATGAASRVETSQVVETRTYYDALGNAVASRDVGGALSQKAYDLLGQVVYDVDAIGYVTGYARSAFGDVTALTRYASVTSLAARTVTLPSQAATKSQVDAALTATGFDHSQDRVLLTKYDQAGRVTEASEPSVYVYDSTGRQSRSSSKTSRNVYDAFGQVVQSKVLRNEDTGTWATTTHYFDKNGHETATIDALGYLTQRTYGSTGNLEMETQYATAVPAGWTVNGFALPAANQNDDRQIVYSYDRLNRKTTESRKNVEFSTLANGTSSRGDVTTGYGYDALGNQTVVTDANGASTFTYFDALGRISAVAAPARTSTASGAALTPLTEFRRDAYGNVVAKIDYANGASAATATSYTPGTIDAANDRSTLASYDSFGHVVQGTDANGASDYTSYDAYGHVAKHWQGVTGNDGVTRTVFEVDVYDKLGRLVESRTPASTSVYTDGVGISTVTQAQAGVISSAMEYNAFGEMTRKGVQGGRQEYFDYDTAGRLWRTNANDGVDRIYLYDAQGNQTADIRSSGSGRVNADIKGFVNAQAADADPYTRRVDIQYDLMGRVTSRAEAARQELQGGVAVQRQFTTATVELSSSTQLDEYGFPLPGAANRVHLGWNSLSSLGSGDVKVYLEYLTPATSGTDENGVLISYAAGSLRSAASGIFNGDEAANGVTFAWPDGTNAGIGTVTRLVVYKKDINGSWQTVIDQAPGYGTNEITVAAPPSPTTGLMLQLRVAGTAGDAGWWTAGLVNFGNSMRFDARGLPVGNYEYRVTVTPDATVGGTAAGSRVTGTGTLGITQPPLNSINTNIHYGEANVAPGIMTWTDPGTSYTQVFRYRVAGSTGGWSELPVNYMPVQSGVPLYVGVDTRGVPPGNYQYELLWTVNGQGAPSAHATGSFVVVADVPSRWVPPVNLPNITGLTLGSGVVGGTIVGYDEGGAPIYSGGTTVPALQWTAAGATVARYRTSGGAWTYLTIDSSGQGTDENGAYAGVQKVLVSGAGPGTYQFEILAGSPPTAQATANLTISAQGAGWYETVYVQVPVSTPVVAYYQPVYETRYGTRTVSWQVWVNDPPYQYVAGYDENGTPLYAWAYPGHYQTQYGTETYAYQVQVGQTPVYATDENGAIIYTVSYVTQAQQVWHAGTTPAPTLQVTTPPYTPGYWTAAIPRQYGVNVTTTAGSVALSTSVDAVIAQQAGINGDTRMLRPTVYQTTDRWGNVLEITDPRASYWKTTYRYNASNQLVRQTQPDAAGAVSGSSPVTAIFYDRMGRQIAVKDANGNVNGQAFDAGGNLVKETHADGGEVSFAYNAFGDKVRSTDAEGKHIGYTYDRMGHMLQMVKGVVAVYSNTGNMLQQVDTRNIIEKWTYDQLGEQLTHANGNAETIAYAYDLRGNLVATTQPLGQVLRDAYDARGRKIGEVDANGALSSWGYDYFGQLKAHMDLGGERYTYTYDNARQLTAQSSSRGQSLSYTYDAAGQLTVIQDWALGKTTTYAYDLSGRKLRERVVQGGITYQDNHMAYDARGNLRDVADARAHVVMEYDLVGNRSRVATSVDYQGTAGEASNWTDRYFKYDAMNRQVVVDAVNSSGDIGTQGHLVTYDRTGNRTSDTYWGTKVAVSGGQQIIYGYNEDGSAIYSGSPASYVQSAGYVREDYRYDKLNRLQGVVRDGTQIDVRYYDGADRVVQSGPAGALAPAYADIINAGLTPGQMNGKETRINRYDANGRLMHQRVLKSDNSNKMDISWDPSEAIVAGYDENNAPISWSGNADGYDAAGNVRGYVVQSYDGFYINEYMSTALRYEGYQEGTTAATSTRLLPGSTTQQYDANGFLVGISDATQARNNRTFVNDANGRALYVNQAGNVKRQMIVNGEVLGMYGAGVDAISPASGYENNPNFANIVDFDFGYSKITANYPSAAPGVYTVRTGDTLQTVAQSAYGDSSLWYRIAEANGLSSSNDLKVGQTLNIPNSVTTINNNSTTFKPYDPSEIEGDKSPSLATPKPKTDWFGVLLMAIVTIVVAIVAPELLPSTWSAWEVAAVSAAAGSVAGQVVGLATGAIDEFSWKSVALSAVSAGITSGLPTEMVVGSKVANAMVKAAVANALTQGVGVVTGLQQRFDWRGVAASGLGAGIGQAIGDSMGLDPSGKRPSDMSVGDFMAKTALKSVTAGLTTAAARGGRVAVQQVAVDAFGNALGSSLADAMGPQRESIYSLASGDSGMGLRPGAGSGLGLSYAGARATGAGAADPVFASDYARGAYDQLVGAISNYQRVDDEDPVLLAANGGGIRGGVAPLGSSARNYRNQMDIASDSAATARMRAAGIDSSSSLLGATAGVASSFGSMAAGTARVGSNMLMQIGNVLTGGINNEHPVMQQVHAEQRALGQGIVNLVSSPVATATDLIEGVVNRYDSAQAQLTDFNRSYELGRLFNDVGQAAVGGGLAIRGAARLGAGTRSIASVEAASGASTEIVGDFTPLKTQGDRLYALVPSNEGAGPLRWIRTDRIDPAPSVHGNSLSNPNPTHIYAIRDDSGSVWKIGESARGTNGLGLSIRAEQQVRDLNLLYPDNFFKSEIRAWQPDKAAGRAYETRVIERYRSMYGQDTLPGNLTNR